MGPQNSEMQIAAPKLNGTAKRIAKPLTDAVPAEVPPLAGIIAFSPATPNSHVALLCRSFGIPFVHVSESADQAALLTVTNRQVMIRAAERFAGCEVAIRPLATDLPAADLEALAELKRPPTLNLPAKQPRGALWVGVVDDLWHFGKPRGTGGPWRDTAVKAGVPSDAYLATGYERKRLTLAHTNRRPVSFRVEAAFTGAGVWSPVITLVAEPSEHVDHQFPAAFGAYWLRVVADQDTVATATFAYD